jgi:hypothetical protein
LVELTVYDSFLALLRERAARVRVGDAADTATEIGALVCLGVTRLPPNGDRQRNKRA